MKSIIQDKKECFICGSVKNLEMHHCLHGNANRKLAEKDGLKVWLCYEHHRGTNGVHGRDGARVDIYLKRIAQSNYMAYYNKTIEDFRQRYGRSYL